MSNQPVSINLVVYNGEKYIRHCFNSIRSQTYKNFEVNIWDNASTDKTREVIRQEFREFQLIENKINIGMWPAQEVLLKHSRGEYIVVISVDIILDENFIAEAVGAMEKDYKIGALQAKIYKYDLVEFEGGKHLYKHIIDTCGFKVFRSRRIINIGHGEEDSGQHNKELEIFAVEGAVPVFRRATLEDCRIQGHFVDPDFFWYGDDIDLAWRMRLFGWKQVFAPRVIAYHDRHTTKKLASDRFSFIKMRKELPLFKRRLDWRNWTLTVIKNDYIGNFFRDLPYILVRQIQLWCYFLIFEPVMILELFKVARLLPRMLKRRRVIMKKVRASRKEIHKWFK